MFGRPGDVQARPEPAPLEIIRVDRPVDVRPVAVIVVADLEEGPLALLVAGAEMPARVRVVEHAGVERPVEDRHRAGPEHQVVDVEPGAGVERGRGGGDGVMRVGVPVAGGHDHAPRMVFAVGVAVHFARADIPRQRGDAALRDPPLLAPRVVDQAVAVGDHRRVRHHHVAVGGQHARVEVEIDAIGVELEVLVGQVRPARRLDAPFMRIGDPVGLRDGQPSAVNFHRPHRAGENEDTKISGRRERNRAPTQSTRTHSGFIGEPTDNIEWQQVRAR